MARFLFSVGRFAARHRIKVLGAWAAVLVAVAVLAAVGGGRTVDDFTVPGTQSSQAAALLQTRIPALAGADTQVVFAVGAGQTIAARSAAVQRALANLRRVPQVAVVSDPLTKGSRAISRDGRYALADVQYRVDSAQVSNATLDALEPAVAVARRAGVQTEFDGSVYPGSSDSGSEAPELIGLIIAFGILLVTFGSLLGGALPIITALVAVVLGAVAVKALTAASMSPRSPGR